jgi:hypothetical protein
MAKQKAPLPTRKCAFVECGKTLSNWCPPNTKYCGHNCKVKAHRLRHREADPATEKRIREMQRAADRGELAGGFAGAVDIVKKVRAALMERAEALTGDIDTVAFIAQLKRTDEAPQDRAELVATQDSMFRLAASMLRDLADELDEAREKLTDAETPEAEAGVDWLANCFRLVRADEVGADADDDDDEAEAC